MERGGWLGQKFHIVDAAQIIVTPAAGTAGTTGTSGAAHPWSSDQLGFAMGPYGYGTARGRMLVLDLSEAQLGALPQVKWENGGWQPAN